MVVHFLQGHKKLFCIRYINATGHKGLVPKMSAKKCGVR